MEFISDYGLFVLKAVTIVVAILVVIGGIVAIGSRNRRSNEGELNIRKINDDLEDHKEQLEDSVLTRDAIKAKEKEKKKEDKEKAKAEKKRLKGVKDAMATVDKTKRIYVLDFDGDIQASQVEHLRQEVTAVLTLATPDDEVVVRLESGGGMVHSYGLGASQLKRVRDRGIPLTVCIDKVAASGGYMMASIADRIVAAPFAIVGSIGVVAQLPNFHRLLKKHDVDYELFTAGKYKRTVTMFGENTEEAREKFQTDLEDTHVLFKNHVKQFRPRIDIEEVANGDIWYGQQALDKRLIDEVGTSDDYLMAACERADVYQVRYEFRKTLQEKLGVAVERGAEGAFTRLLTMLTRQQQNKG
ncbi:MAG: protease SohB [Oceanospirillaceae bacterium]|uniref:protease SohB n=1 Tax=unclassified Thalassolituus TaxID=2624967 RepID=UPI000C4646BC|nr:MULTISPECIES: protease SohB [unclassified Thalassolituus]MAX97811.1 protease SohB [Oceanospirillaceae bacterium]MBL34837.1 protease SohB [Oceanospirillaceae bacterium]MBS53457.1 protease SohB [Oceanospirillaceae bacterium]